MNHKKTFIIIAFIAVVFMAFGFQNSSEHKVLFEKAKFTMETKGDLKGAIKLFKQIIEKYPDEREYAARSQLYIGLCYEKLGLKQAKQAKEAFQKVIDVYPEQAEAVKVANEKLSVLNRAQTVIETRNKEFKIRQIWAGPDVDIMGGVSPDGRYLSCVDWETGDLAVRELVTGKKRRLTNKGSWFDSPEQALFSILSPDGKKAAYTWLTKDIVGDLRIIGLDGSKPRVLYQHEEIYAEPAAWSPDGKHILAIFTNKDRINQIVLVSVADGSVRVLKTLDWRYPEKMSFSPEGRYIAYDFPPQEDSPQRDIFLLSINGKREITLVEHPADDKLLGWAPRGNWILFSSDRAGSFDAWAIPVTEGIPQGTPKRVKSDIGKISPLGFTRSGSFYYGLITGVNDVYIATLDLDTSKVLTPAKKATQRFVGSNTASDWSPDGLSLAFISERRPIPSGLGSKIISILSLKTGNERELSPKLFHFNRLRWAPDGRSILVTGFDRKRRWGIYQIDAQTAEVIPLVQVKSPLESVVGQVGLSPDGKTIFYLLHEFAKKLHLILARDIETDQEKELYRTVGRSSVVKAVLSPDGRQLIFIVVDQETSILKVMPSAGGKACELLRLKKPEYFIYTSLAWAPDGGQIIFGKGKLQVKPEPELWRISVEGGEPKRLGLAMERLRHINVHPDGRRITFTAGQYKAEVWVMENILSETQIKKKSKSQQQEKVLLQ